MNRIELIEAINSSKTLQNDDFNEMEFPQEIQEIIDVCRIVASDLDVEKHRWYETSITVYELDEEYFGIRYITTIYSENTEFSDIYHTLEAFPMKAISTITYVKE